MKSLTIIVIKNNNSQQAQDGAIGRNPRNGSGTGGKLNLLDYEMAVKCLGGVVGFNDTAGTVYVMRRKRDVCGSMINNDFLFDVADSF